MSKKLWGKHTIKWNLHLLVGSTDHLTSAESFVFDVENKFLLFPLESERNDCSISLVSSKVRWNNWQVTSCPALRICKYEIHVIKNMVNKEPYNRKSRKYLICKVPLILNETSLSDEATYWVGGWREMVEETEECRWVIFSESSDPPDLQKPAACVVPMMGNYLRRKCFILDMPISCFTYFSLLFLKMFTKLIHLACIQQ